MLDLAVVGSRTFPYPKSLYETMTDEQKFQAYGRGQTMVKAALANVGVVRVVSGGAEGPDTWGVDIATELGWPEPLIIRPNWKKYGNGAGFKRNTEIVEAADELIAFWDLESRGTWDSIAKAVKLLKPVLVVGPTGDMLFALTADSYKELGTLNTADLKRVIQKA